MSIIEKINKAMKDKDYTLLRNFLSDTVRITSSNGTVYSADSFIKRLLSFKKLDTFATNPRVSGQTPLKIYSLSFMNQFLCKKI